MPLAVLLIRINSLSLSYLDSVNNPIWKLSKETLIYGIGGIAARFLNYILVPFFTYRFIPLEYGIVGLLYGGISICITLATLGLENSYIRFSSTSSKSYSYYTTSITMILLANGFLFLLVMLFSSTLERLFQLNPSQSYLLFIMVGIAFADSIASIANAQLRINQKSLVYSLLRIGQMVLYIFFTLLFIIKLNKGIEGIFYGNLISSISITIIAITITSEYCKFKLSFQYIKQALHFGIPYIFVGIGVFINQFFDRFFISLLPKKTIETIYGTQTTAVEIIGIYNACHKLGIFMLLLATMFRLAWQPFFMRYSQSSQKQELFPKIFFYFNTIAAICFILISSFVYEISNIKIPFLAIPLIDNRYHQGLIIVPWLLIGYWFYGWYLNFTPSIYYQKKTFLLIIPTLLGSLSMIIFNLILTPIMGMEGAAISNMLCQFTMAGVLFVLTKKLLCINYPWLPCISTMAIVIIGSVLSNNWFHQSTNTNILLYKILWIGGILVIITFIVYFYHKIEKKRLTINAIP